MACEAAFDAEVDRPLIDLYEASVISLDPALYIENAGVSRLKQLQMIETMIKAMSNVETYLAETGAAEYAGSPILTAKSWLDILEGMPKFSGNAELCLFPDGLIDKAARNMTDRIFIYYWA
ncbi:hypothetical protein A0H81_10664 [Grifola frondosa]|uniref:Uncharacterized protein n=1 Tax=Grifola frondosa TaxID=5627 RepID=A0A1C7LXK0_GRIFR|nr:hypothetical protein A0H81_10664 [Grifola frondosa]